MIVVEHGLDLHLRGVVEHLVAIQAVLINGQIAIERQLEDIGEEVHLLVNRLNRIIESGIHVFLQINLPVDVTSPYHLLGHVDSGGKHQLCPLGHRGRRLLGFLLGGIASGLGLGKGSQAGTCYHQD